MKTTAKTQWHSWMKILLGLISIMMLVACGSDNTTDGDDEAANQSPLAVLAASVVNGTAPLDVIFDGSASSDPDGDPLSFDWDFGDGTTQAAGGQTATHTYTTAGQYTAVLSVTDPDGETDTDSIAITVQAGNPQQVNVPNVTGMTQASAQADLVADNLVMGNVTSEHSNTVASGNVISQSPVAGTLVDEGTAVDLLVSLGPIMVNVPDLVNLTQAAATTAITNAGLTVGTVNTANNDTVPSGEVISQNPAAGASVASGSAINITVSLGPAMVSVPNVVGQTYRLLV